MTTLMMEPAALTTAAADRARVAHLPCPGGDGPDLSPDLPEHALCGRLLLGIDAPSEAPKCPGCEGRMELAGGTFGYLLGMASCDTHGGAR